MAVDKDDKVIVETPLENRIVMTRATFIRDGTQASVIGAYMPVRWECDGIVLPAWVQLGETIAQEGNVLILGDLNAETPYWRTQRGSATVTTADKELEKLLKDDANPLCVFTGAQATYRESTVGTQIDHVLVSAGLAPQMDNATTLPGVCGDDHEILTAKLHYKKEEGDEEEHRPIVKWHLTAK